ncbi:hypothetical protein BH09VER1_BH09VER1_19400 [soil metagenome]
MKNSLPRTLLLFLLGSAVLLPTRSQAEAAPGEKKPNVIILKLDDLTRVSPNFNRVLDFLKSRNIHASVGIIANSLEGNKEPYFAWIKERNESGLVEFWFHGYDHKMWKDASGKDLQEFKGVPYEQQKEHFVESQALAKEKLGFAFRTFGSPFNGSDEATLKVISEDPDMKIFLYGLPTQASAAPNVMIMDRTPMNIENPTFVPNTERVVHDLQALGGKREFFVIQGHPDQWDEPRMAEFGKMIDYLTSQGVIFATPYEYYQYKQDPAAHPLPVPAVPGSPIAANSAPLSELKPPARPAAPKPAGLTAPSGSSEPAGENLVANGDFENDKVGWSVFSPPDSLGGMPTLDVAGDGPHGGSASGAMSCTSPVRFAIVNFVNGTWTEGDRFRVSAWVRASSDYQPQSGTPGFMVRVTMFPHEGSSIAPEDGLFYLGLNKATKGPDTGGYNDQGVPTTWTKVEGVFQIPAGTARLNVCGFIWKGSGTLFFDDFRLEPVDKSVPLSGN